MATTDIPHFLNLLARHAGLIEAAYHEGSILETDENTSAVRTLHTARVFSPREGGHYGLARSVRQLLDENMQRQKLFGIGGNIGDEINRMEKLLLEVEAAANSADQIDRLAHYIAELCESLYDIKDLINQDLLQFSQVMGTRFSDVRTVEQKMRQNAHYLERTKALLDVIEQMNRSEVHRRFSSPLVGEAGSAYRMAIARSISNWSARLLANSQIFEQYMFSFRQIAEETRRMRAFTRFLKEGGQSHLPDALHRAADCPALCRIEAAEKTLWPDIFSIEGSRAVANIIQALKPLENHKKTERPAGTRRQAADPIVIDDDLSPEEKALSVFLSSLPDDGSWHSAGRWAERVSSVVRAEFLEHVLTWSEEDRDRDLHGVRFTEVSEAPFLANISIGDIEICLVA